MFIHFSHDLPIPLSSCFRYDQVWVQNAAEDGVGGGEGSWRQGGGKERACEDSGK